MVGKEMMVEVVGMMQMGEIFRWRLEPFTALRLKGFQSTLESKPCKTVKVLYEIIRWAPIKIAIV